MPSAQHLARVALAGALFLCVTIRAQDTRLDRASHVERQRVQRLAGVRDLPAPPPLTNRSRLDTLENADRYPFERFAPQALGTGPEIVEFVLPAGPDGTGTDHAEVFEYQLGTQYDDNGPLRPMVIAYHGYSNSASSVAKLSTIDEECEARGWIYLSVTGISDQIFGTLDAQKNVEAAIRWMIDTYRVDEERLYMVGFSMGAGVAANFAARHRDPDGVMIAALGLVSGSFDWTMSYDEGGAPIKAVFESPLNFGTSPEIDPFAYKRTSAMHFDPASYPTYPGTLLPLESMARNLGSTPTYVTWDDYDSVALIEKQNKRLVKLFEELGTEHEIKITAFTLDPNTGFPATHSWYVLKEKKAFDFFAAHRAKRRPQRFDALVDAPSDVSFLSIDTRDEDAFGRVSVMLEGATLEVSGARGVREVSAAMPGVTALGALDAFEATGASIDRHGFMLRLTRWSTTPDYALDTSDAYVPGTAPRLADHSLALPIPGFGTLTARPVDEPTWTANLVAPATASLGTTVPVELTTQQATASTAWLLLGPLDELLRIGDELSLSVAPTAPNQLFALPFSNGMVSALPVPSDVALLGAVFRTQAVLFDAAGVVVEISNAQRVDITP